MSLCHTHTHTDTRDPVTLHHLSQLRCLPHAVTSPSRRLLGSVESAHSGVQFCSRLVGTASSVAAVAAHRQRLVELVGVSGRKGHSLHELGWQQAIYPLSLLFSLSTLCPFQEHCSYQSAALVTMGRSPS